MLIQLTLLKYGQSQDAILTWHTK